VLALLGEAAQACQVELGWTTVVRSRETYIEADLGSGDQPQHLTIGVTNKSARGGHFGRQLEHLCKASGGRTPAAVRTVAFPTGTASEKRVADLLRDGGRKVLCSEGDLRSVLAMRAFAKLRADAPLDAWRRRDRPLLRREGLAELFAATSSGVLPPPPKPVVSVPRPNPPTPVPKLPPIKIPIPVATTGVTTPGGELHVGTTVGLDPRPLDVSVELLVRHSGVLGSPGSGKTTLALNLVEQLLEHDIAVVLVDRKGDLAGYARPDWFESIPDHDQRARGKELADRIDVRLFTPGTGGGRSLGFGVVPRLDGVPDHERSRVVIHATGALAAMLRLGSGVRDQTRRAILSQAIMVLSERVAPAGLESLIDLIESRDDALIARASKFDDRLFTSLVSDLETLRLNEPELFDRSAEQLSADALLGRGADGRTPLSIVSTRFLGDADRVQAWAAHLFVELGRYCMRTPQARLQTLIMLDEADQYMPATSKPPSKDPLMDLLKRARSGGLGVMLATQTPGDLDYKSRDLISSWFIGKIGDNRSIDKVRPLLERKPAIAGRLGQLPSGQFIVVNDTNVAEIQRRPSLLRTDQLPEQEILTLARANRR
jgi:DNA helicase HerA-like ATPase